MSKEKKCRNCGHWTGSCEIIVFEVEHPHLTKYAMPTDPGGLSTGEDFGCVLFEPCAGCARDKEIAMGVVIYPHRGPHPEHTHTLRQGIP